MQCLAFIRGELRPDCYVCCSYHSRTSGNELQVISASVWGNGEILRIVYPHGPWTEYVHLSIIQSNTRTRYHSILTYMRNNHLRERYLLEFEAFRKPKVKVNSEVNKQDRTGLKPVRSLTAIE